MSLLALQDLFRRQREKATGLWKLGLEPGRTIYLEMGDVVFASSTHPSDRLTYLLVERGKLTQAQLDYAMENLKPGLSIGKNLIEMGYITQRDLLDVARAQVERIVLGAIETPGEEPVFEAHELDASVVRLPLDTPRLLLMNLLEMKDRERLLELLGPLNQVVVLQGRHLQEMTLPPDLAKLPPLLDGTHTLLELSRESLAEPLRLGTFALFLREMGWARLHELPPLDRQAIDRALRPEPEPLSPPMPERPSEGVPSLFSTIEAASRPTTNLEHLSSALDGVEMPRAVVDPSGFSAESGQAMLPTPAMELPPLPELTGRRGEEPPEPEVSIRPSTFGPMDVPDELPLPSLHADSEGKPSGGLVPLLGGLALGLLLLGGGWWWLNHPRAGAKVEIPAPVTPAQPVPVKVAPPVPAPLPEPPIVEAPKPEPPKPEPPKPEPPKPVPAPPKVAPKPAEIGTSIAERLETLRRGDLEFAAKQGEKLLRETRKGQFSLRLEIACMGDTIRRALEVFPDGKPDLFVVPIKLRDGRTCYQVFYGRFPSLAAAEKQVKVLPSIFREGANRPKPFMVTEIPSKQ